MPVGGGHPNVTRVVQGGEEGRPAKLGNEFDQLFSVVAAGGRGVRRQSPSCSSTMGTVEGPAEGAASQLCRADGGAAGEGAQPVAQESGHGGSMDQLFGQFAGRSGRPAREGYPPVVQGRHPRYLRG